MDPADQLAEASIGQRIATFLMAALFAPCFGFGAWKMAGSVEDWSEDAGFAGGAVILGLLGVATLLVAVLAIKPSLAKYQMVMAPIFGILALMGLAYRLWYPF